MRILNILLASALTFAGALLPSVNPQTDEGSVSVSIGPTNSGLVSLGSPIQIVGNLKNSTAQMLSALVANVYVPDVQLESREELNEWLDEDETKSTSEAPVSSSQLGDLGTDQLRSFATSIPSSAFGQNATKPTVIPIIVRVVSENVEVAFAKTTALLIPGSTVQPISVSVVTPITSVPDNTGLLSSERLTALTAPDGELQRELQVATTHSLALGIDPMVIASIRLLGANAPPTAIAWLDALSKLPNETFALSFADADQGLALQAGAKTPIEPFGLVDQDHPIETPSAGPTADTTEGEADFSKNSGELTNWNYAFTNISWPTPGSLRTTDVKKLVSAGTTRLLLDSTQLKSEVREAANAQLDGISGARVTTTDGKLSMLLDLASRANTLAESSDYLARLTTNLALMATGTNNQVVISLNRDGAGLGSRVNEVLNSVETLPFVSTRTLAQVFASPSTTEQFVSAQLPNEVIEVAKQLLNSERQVTAFSSVVDQPELLNWPRRVEMLGLFAIGWQSTQSTWKAAVNGFLDESGAILNSVHIPEGSTITLLQEKGNMPIAVVNELDFPVTVYIQAKPDRAILDILDDRVELKIEANSQAKASVPVQSIANGTVLTVLSLRSATGIEVSDPTFVTLNVQAGWETAATIVVAIILLLMFGAGIWRTVLKRKQTSRLEANR
ncbi:MAG: hypothetical protein KF867_01705 [Cryobacterium sp.]|nr:hypothetical protein [Cryobacterium sp.]